MRWPEEAPTPVRRDWRDSFAAMADLALIGILVTVAALPVFTLASAVRAGSMAVRHRYTTGELPPVRPLLTAFHRGLWKGAAVTALALLATALLALDLAALAGGAVPGGTPLLLVTAAVTLWLVGVAVATVVHCGRHPDAGWRTAAGWALRLAPHRSLPAALAVGLAAFLSLAIPATIPLLPGFALFAAHVLTDRLSP
ncbi:hypothetical protein Val02_34220 [Virgisporangium aliadipatigenens]|uniref:DUF624 domain-containing protein n=2 Tax=Virgisporangium aliadipatigenens TaxID=741659 RepID=A0A8J3YMF7_9ACTN|nr:hypothetical protein Val02_34220 [Virgisporangium aliadipatigenens]